MLKGFFSDQPTPKASEHANRNPFDLLNRPGTPSSRKSSFSLAPPTPTSGGGFKIPFFGGHQQAHNATAESTSQLPSSMSGSEGPATPGGNSTAGQMAAATTSITKHEPDFTLQSGSMLAKRKLHEDKKEHQHSPSLSVSSTQAPSQRGTLSLKLIQARNLAVHSSAARPYIVATYDQNEFVGREPIAEDAPVMVSYVGRSGAQTPMQRNSPPRGSGANFGSLGSSHAQNALAKSLEAHRQSQLYYSRQKSVDKHSLGKKEDRTARSAKKGEASAYDPVWKQEVIFDVVSEDPGQMTISVYDRSQDEGFLGAVDLSPRLNTSQTIDTWLKLQARADETVSGEIRIQYRFDQADGKKNISVKDFEFLRMIGKGTFGRVFQVRKKDTRRIYAMKVLSKREIIAKKEVAHTIGERKILQRSSECPFLLGLKFSFQSDNELFLVMDYKSGGELFHHLQQEGRFSEDRARFYTAEIVLAFEHLHKYDIVYRDLKPENILLDATGHICLCDFGLSKPDLPSDALTNTFCGTTEYLAPEVLLDDHGYSMLVDFWSLGVLLFEMCCGWSPFYAEDTQQMYKNICFGKIKFPRGVIGDDGKQFVKGLLNRNPRHRLGAQRDAAELKEHPFFNPIDWTTLAARKVVPPFTPVVDSDESVANFDAEFTDADVTKEAPASAVFDENDPSAAWIQQASSASDRQPTSNGVPMRSKRGEMASSLSGSVQDAFRGFSYAGSYDEHQSHPWLNGNSIRITPADQAENGIRSMDLSD